MLIIVACASSFGEYLTIEQIPNKIADAVVSNIHSPILFLIAVNLLLLFAGTFMDIISAMLIMVPIFSPLLAKYGLDPIHFAIIFIFNMEIGYLTPPLGVNLYVAAGVSGMDFGEVVRACVPTILIMLGLLFIYTYIPQISLWLPSMIMK